MKFWRGKTVIRPKESGLKESLIHSREQHTWYPAKICKDEFGKWVAKYDWMLVGESEWYYTNGDEGLEQMWLSPQANKIYAKFANDKLIVVTRL